MSAFGQNTGCRSMDRLRVEGYPRKRVRRQGCFFCGWFSLLYPFPAHFTTSISAGSKANMLMRKIISFKRSRSGAASRARTRSWNGDPPGTTRKSGSSFEIIHAVHRLLLARVCIGPSSNRPRFGHVQQAAPFSGSWNVLEPIKLFVQRACSRCRSQLNPAEIPEPNW
jgi:hypothetical protein